jgi:MYXO-CTERM domain-containing protein
MSRRALIALAVASTLCVARPASAWTPIDTSRPVWSGTVPYAMNSAGSADLGADSSEMIVQQAFGDWTRVSCTSLTASYGGRTGSAPNGGDMQSVVGWVESGWRYDAAAIGVTQPQWTVFGGTARIVEADMELNGVNFTWITGSGVGSRVNGYSIVLHESGHYYGLGHSSDSSATMYYAYSGGIAALNADDQTGICTLYPGSMPPPTGCHTTGCPAGQTCSASGTCTTSMSMGTGGLCSTCTSSASCTAGVCLRYPDGIGYCGTSCSSNADCQSGDTCATVTGVGGQCIHLVSGNPSCAGASGCRSDADCGAGMRCNTTSGACEAGSTTGAGLGAPCSAATDCASSVCLGGACSQTCDWLNPSSCPSGFYCNGQATGTCTGTGLCQPGTAGGAAIGSACASNTDCTSLFCAEGVCSSPCIPGGTTSCPTGYACQVGTSAGCGSCQLAGQIGDACMMNEDCASRLCVNTACSATCDPASGGGCPTGFNCVDRGMGVGACVAMAGGLGAACHSATDCLSGQCAVESGGSYCTRACDAVSPCPRSYNCITAEGGAHICRPRNIGGCGCSAAGAGERRAGAAMLFLGLAAVAVAQRRRAARERR